MCGIAGIVSFTSPVPVLAADRMARSMLHRGPDSSGGFSDGTAALVNTRLAIVDLEHGQQPFSDEKGAVRAVMNGEVYNHRRLAATLHGRGHRLHTGCDTEVIPHLYEDQGAGFADLLDGDFAVAVWDAAERKLLLARDRVGVKPLFYVRVGDSLLFASEVKALVASGIYQPDVDPQGLRDCLSYGQPVGAGTFWRDVRQVPPGSVLEIGEQGERTITYWRPLSGTGSALGGRQAAAAFKEVFVEAVRKRLPDEVPAAATLSGGLDSTAVVGAAARELGVRLPTYTIRLPGELLDEGVHSRGAARELAVHNTEVAVTSEQAVEALPETLWHLEAPQWFGVAPPFLHLVRAAAADGVKVALTGDGADELLAGYDFYRLMQAQRLTDGLRVSAASAPLWAAAARWLGAPEGVGAHIQSVNGGLGREGMRAGPPAWLYVWLAMQQTSSALLDGHAASTASPLPEPPPLGDPVRASLWHEHGTRLSNWVLPLSDRMSMAAGVEVRVPFMDRDLLDLTDRLTVPSLLLPHREKRVLKAAAADFVPAAVRRRRKKPFFTPVNSWYISGAGQALAAEYLSADRARAAGLFPVEAVVRLHARARSLSEDTWAGTTAGWACLMVMSCHLLQEAFADAAVQALRADTGGPVALPVDTTPGAGGEPGRATTSLP
jgi:asparagine synthase (glutamine-hydrolysing)